MNNISDRDFYHQKNETKPLKIEYTSGDFIEEYKISNQKPTLTQPKQKRKFGRFDWFMNGTLFGYILGMLVMWWIINKIN